MAGGLDRQTLGDATWRRIAVAPQYHENHIFTAPLSFNLLWKWHKIKIRLTALKGLPPLRIYVKTGYYAPSK